MRTELYFVDIKEQLMRQLRLAKQKVIIAIAWFTDEDLIRLVTQKKQEDLDVKVAISNSVENFRRVDKFKSYLTAGGELFVSQEAFLHHKFCLIDDTIFINGSYNWSYSAQHNEENITIMWLDPIIEEQLRLIRKINTKFDYLKNRNCKPVESYQDLLTYANISVDNGAKLMIMDEKEMALRQEFEDHIKRSIDIAKKENISSNYDRLLERMKTDGGGVYFVKRILREEMAKNEMKTGFNKLVQCIPHRVDLSLEYLVCQPQYATLFTKEEIDFCTNLMKKYNLA